MSLNYPGRQFNVLNNYIEIMEYEKIENVYYDFFRTRSIHAIL